MKLHGNAMTCPHSRSLIVRRVGEEGWSLAQAAAAAGVSECMVAKWLARWRAEGKRGDSRTAPRHQGGSRDRTPDKRRSRQSPRCGECG